MKHEHDPLGELMAHWTACSEQFLAAAGYLPPDQREMVLPRVHLLRLAVEYRLKAFVCARRRGTPASRDLTHLARLAGLCGLTLAPEQARIIVWLNGLPNGLPNGSPNGSPNGPPKGAPREAPGSSAPGLEMVDDLCRAISAQAGDASR